MQNASIEIIIITKKDDHVMDWFRLHFPTRTMTLDVAVKSPLVFEFIGFSLVVSFVGLKMMLAYHLRKYHKSSKKE